MKNSTDNTTPPKPPKKKGPIRTGAVVPTIIFAVIVGVFFVFFFDGVVRRGIEYAGTHIHGAEVDVGRVATSFIHARLEIDDIQVTDKEHPERNLVQLGSIKFQMSWDALLRAKILVDEASILNIQALAERKHKGYVLPPPPPPPSEKKEDKNKPSSLDKVQEEVAQQAAKKYNGNFLGDVAGVLGGSDPKAQLQGLQGQLKSDAKIKEMEKDINDKKAKWDTRIKALPQSKDFQGYNDRIKALKFDAKNPAEFAKNVQEAQKIINEAQDKIKVIDQTQKDLKTDIGTEQQAYKDIDKMINEDIHDLQGKLKLPNIDAKEFSQQLFMAMIEKRLGSLAKYVELARQYAPPKKTKDQKAAAKAENVIPPKRGTGHSYHFPITTGYPLFWLKHAAISSEAGSSEYGGNIKGEIKDLTSDPPFIGRPTLILVKGDFPKQDIQGLDAKITLDHTTDTAKESMVMKVAHFPVAENKLSDSPDVKLALQKASGSSDINATFIDEQLTMDMKNAFTDVKYDVEAKNKMVQDLIDNVLKGIPVVTVNAEIKGSLHDFDVHVNSNLGDELSKGFQKQLQAKIDEAKGQLKKMVDEKIGGNRDKLKADLDNMTGGLTKDVDGKKGDADKMVKQAQNQLGAQKGGGQKQLEDQGKKLLKGLGL
jgi:uncharacterized protein (TIGR03545 family)